MIGMIKRAGLLVFFIAALAMAIPFCSAGFFGPSIGVPFYGGDLDFSVNMSGVVNPRIYIRESGDNYWQYGNVSIGNGRYSLAEGHVLPRVYEFFYRDAYSGVRFPLSGDGVRVSVPGSKGVFYNKAIDVIRAEPAMSCAPWSDDFACDYEDWQAFMVLGFSEAYHLTGNESYESVVSGFVSSYVDADTGSPSDGFFETCDYKRNDFDCDTLDGNDFGMLGPAPSGARRQASMIYSMWEAYKWTRNGTIRQIAMNYTNGSAEECDVWGAVFSAGGDFDCGNADDQGQMMLAYFDAYEQTANAVYLDIAENLSSLGFGYNGSDFLALGFFKGYEMTGNETYLERGLDVAYDRISSCLDGSCDVFNQSLNVVSLIRAYEVSGNYSLKVAAYDALVSNFSGPCNPWNNTFSCGTPGEQGVLALALLRGYQAIGDDSGFYAPHISDVPVRASNLTVNVSFWGMVREPKIYFRRMDDKWISGDLSFETGGYVIPGMYLSGAGVYEYYFIDDFSGARFPSGSGTLKFTVSDLNDTMKLAADNFSATDSSDSFSFTYCGAASDSFMCSYDNYQGAMIYGFSEGYYHTSDTDYADAVYGFFGSQIDYSDSVPMYGADQWATCDYSDVDFDCGTDSIDGSATDFDGALRQAWMGYSLFDAYSVMLNSSFRETAVDYSFGSADGCDVWDNVPDYECSNADVQGLMILFYLKGYEMTGDLRLKSVASNLSLVGYSMSLGSGSGSDYLALGLFEGYDLIGNSSYLERALNITSSREDVCVSSPCDTMNYSFAGLAAWSAYLHNGSSYYLNLSMNKTLASPSGGCDPWASTPDYSCYYPDEQGAMMGLYYRAYGSYASDIDVYSLQADLVGLRNVAIGDSINVSCIAANLGDSILYDVNLTVYFDSGLNVSGNLSYYFDYLDVSQNVSVNWTLVALESAGSRYVSCNVSTYTLDGSDGGLVVVNAGDSINVTVDAPLYVSIGEYFNSTCTVQNNGSSILHDVNVSVYFGSSFNTTDNVSYFVGNISPSEFSVLNFTFGAVELGYHMISCNVTSIEINSSALAFVNVGTGASLAVNLSSDDSFYIEDSLNVTCTVSNNGSISIDDVDVSLNFSDGLYTSDVSSYHFDSIAVGANVSLNWSLLASRVGNMSLGCIVSSESYNVSTTKNVSVVRAYDGYIWVDSPYSVNVDDDFNISCTVLNNGTLAWTAMNVSLSFESGFTLDGNMSQDHAGLVPGENATFYWNLSASSAGSRVIYCIVNTSVFDGLNSSVILVNSNDVDDPVVPSGGGSSSSSSSSGSFLSYVYFNESYEYFVNESAPDFVGSVSEMFALFSVSDYVDDDALNYSVSDSFHLNPECFDVLRFYESNLGYARYGLYITYLCDDGLSLPFMIYDVLPYEFKGLLDVSLESSDDFDMYLADDNLSYLLVFGSGDGGLSLGDVLSINYTVSKSMLTNMLIFVDEPFMYSIVNEFDVDAPLLNITYPPAGANISYGLFNLTLEFYDASDVSCVYGLDGDDFEEMGVLFEHVSMFSSVNGTYGPHCVTVVCNDSYGNTNRSSVCFFSGMDIIGDIGDEITDNGDDGIFDLFGIFDRFDLNDVKNMVFEIDYRIILLLLALLALLYLSYRTGYLSYVAMDVLLKFMILLDKLGDVGRSFSLYPLIVRLYDDLDRNPGLKDSVKLRADIARVMGVLELYSLTRQVSGSVVTGSADPQALEGSLEALRVMYDRLSRSSDVDKKFLLWVRERYIEGAQYVAQSPAQAENGNE